MIFLGFMNRPSFGLTTLKAEAAWSPKDGGKWEETDFEKDLQKLEVESEKRLEEKIRELMFNIEKTGQGSN